MNNQNLQTKLEELEVPYDKIEEVLAYIEKNTEDTKPEKNVGSISYANIMKLQNLLMTEKDWRRRARLAARIISIKLDE